MNQTVLDHGYVNLIETWGSDERIIESARMSTDGAFKRWGTPDNPGDEKLLAYLYNHKHSTPFEMAGMTIEVKAPIMVFREWMRHRTQSYNEMSARYIPIPDENYMPTVERCLIVDPKNKQAGKIKDARDLNEVTAIDWLTRLDNLYKECESVYQRGLNEGMPKEIARLCLSVGRYSKMRASANLRNWLAFLTLRNAPDAQWEIREYAKAVGREIEIAFPKTWELFIKSTPKMEASVSNV